MNCPECNVVVAETVAACPNCGCPIDSAYETVLKAGAVTFTNVSLKGMATAIGGAAMGGIVGRRLARTASDNLGKNGYGVLTDRRFVFGGGKALKKADEGSSIGFAEMRAKGEITFDIPLDAILGVSEGKQGFSSLFALETGDGDYKFALLRAKRLPEWIAAFNGALGRG